MAKKNLKYIKGITKSKGQQVNTAQPSLNLIECSDVDGEANLDVLDICIGMFRKEISFPYMKPSLFWNDEKEEFIN